MSSFPLPYLRLRTFTIRCLRSSLVRQPTSLILIPLVGVGWFIVHSLYVTRAQRIMVVVCYVSKMSRAWWIQLPRFLARRSYRGMAYWPCDFLFAAQLKPTWKEEIHCHVGNSGVKSTFSVATRYMYVNEPTIELVDREWPTVYLMMTSWRRILLNAGNTSDWAEKIRNIWLPLQWCQCPNASSWSV